MILERDELRAEGDAERARLRIGRAVLDLDAEQMRWLAVAAIPALLTTSEGDRHGGVGASASRPPSRAA